MLNRKSKVIFLIGPLLILGGCASSPSLDIFGPTQKEYAQMTEEERRQSQEKVLELTHGLSTYWDRIGKHLYYSNQLVNIGAGHYMIWEKLPGDYGQVVIYRLLNPEGMDFKNYQSVYVALADKDGNIIHGKDRSGLMKPNKIMADVQSTEDIGRLVTRGVFQVTAAATNGVIAAKIRADHDCGDNCGNTTLISNSDSASRSDSGNQVKVETSSEIGNVPMD